MVKKRKMKAAKKDKGKSKNIILIIFLVVFIGLGINLLSNSKSIKIESNNLTDIKILYFYLPTCPNCQAVKPYMTYLENKYPQVTFYKYNLRENEGTSEFNYYRKKFDNPT
jgi:thiol-disulfide isomerase/thioredoxin